MARAPRVGTIVYNPRFGGGATARVVRILPMTGKRGVRVHVHLIGDGGKHIENRGRVWSLGTWDDFVEHARKCREELSNASATQAKA